MKKETSKVFEKSGKLFSKLNFLGKVKLPKIPKVERKEITRPVTEIGLKLKPQVKFKPKLQYIIPVLLVALGVSIYLTAKNNKKVQQTDENTSGTLTQTPTNFVEPTEEPMPAEQPDNTAFYDLKLTDATIQPNGIAVFNDNIVVTDKNTGKIYSSSRTTPKFTAANQVYTDIDNLVNIKGQIGFTDTQGYKVLKPSDLTVVEDYKSTALGITAAYADYIYTINGDKITRYAKENNTLNGTLWGQSSEMTEVKSFGISYSLFMLKNDGTIVKYTSGEKNTFELTGENTELNNPVQLVADVDFDYVYVADTGNKRVVSFDKNGKIIKEYKAEDIEKWNDIKSIGISPDEKTLYVLTGTRIYETAL
jgi:hypothetical protein